MSSTHKVKLSLDKFIDFLKRHSYILVEVYCEKKNIRFAECRTPHQQKTFLVYLPEKYVMIIPSKFSDFRQSLKRLNISFANILPSSRQIEFMSNMKGVLLECDLVAISSESVCMYRNNNKMTFFDIIEIEKLEVELETTKVDETVDEITTLEKDT